MEHKHDLTQGVIWKKLLLYFIPIAAGTLFEQLYNAVDALIVGRFVGTQALAAVGGSTSTLINLIINFFVALSSGAGVIIANSFGARDNERVERSVHTAMLIGLYIGLFLTVVLFFAGPALLKLLKVPEDTLADSILYLRIYFFGSIFLMLYNMGSGIMRAMGDSKKPFWYLVIGCVLNIILDAVFVILFHLGVAGVAWATLIAQALSCLLVVVDLMRVDDVHRLQPKKLRMHWFTLRQMMRIGIPSGLQSAMYGISNMLLQVGINLLGTTVVAAWSLSGKIDGIYWACTTALGTAIVNFVAQNHGAGKPDRIRTCIKKGLWGFDLITLLLSGLILLLANPLLHLFTTDADLIRTTWKIVIFFVPLYFLWTTIEAISATLRGLGDAVRPAIIIGITVCLFRVIWLLTAFRWKRTLIIICLSYPISWGLANIALFIRCRKVMKAL